MTQYYEPEARRLEAEANRSNDPAEQNRLWAEAAAIGTPVELDENGDEIWPTHCECGRALPCRHCQ